MVLVAVVVVVSGNGAGAKSVGDEQVNVSESLYASYAALAASFFLRRYRAAYALTCFSERVPTASIMADQANRPCLWRADSKRAFSRNDQCDPRAAMRRRGLPGGLATAVEEGGDDLTGGVTAAVAAAVAGDGAGVVVGEVEEEDDEEEEENG